MTLTVDRGTRGTVLGLLAGGLTLALDRYGAYKRWWWYDNVAHFLGGVALGGLVGDPDTPLAQDLALVGVVTFAWELLEYRTNTHPWDDGSREARRQAAEDTVLDSILVGAGAYLAAKSQKHAPVRWFP